MVTIWSTAGQTLADSVRNRMVSGSSTISVRLPSNAAARMVKSKPYLAARHQSAGACRLPRHRRKENRSNSVPIGHSQPHHTRPKPRVRATVISASADSASSVRLLIQCASIARASRRIGKFTTIPGHPPRRDHTNRATKTNKAAYCTTRRNVTHRCGVQPL